MRSDEPAVSSSLLFLLNIGRTKEATDKRDRSRALLGTVSDGADYTSLITYSKDVTATSLYLRVVKLFLKQHGAIGLSGLSHYGGKPVSIPGLPSWVPDRTNGLTTVKLGRLASEPIHSAASQTKPSMHIMEDGRSLRVRGGFVDKITFVNDAAPDQFDQSELPSGSESFQDDSQEIFRD